MRTDITAPEITLLESGAYAEHWRVKVANGDGTLIDVSTRLHAGTINLPNPDATIGTATLEFRRELDVGATTSLAPLIDASTFNRLDDTVTISPLLDIGREATVEIAVTAIGAARPAGGSALWHEVIGGFAKQPSWPKRFGNVTLEVQDRAYKLMRTYVETSATYAASTTVEATIQAILDDVMGGGAYPVTVDDVAAGGTTGSALAADHTVYQIPVWEAIQNMASSIGWVLWYRYDNAGAAVLTLTEPRRAKVAADYTFTNAQIKDVVKLTVIEEDIRNVVVVDYVDVAGVVQTTADEDATSIAKYGGIRRYARLVEDESSPIRAAAEADELRDAMLSDLKDPDADMAIETLGAWWPGEPAVDLYTFSANTVMFDNAQTLAPYSISISFSVGSLSNATVAVRGKPSGGSGRWLGRPPGKPGDGIPEVSGNASYNPAGYVQFDFQGDIDMLAIRYLADDTAFPSAASVHSGGTLVATRTGNVTTTTLLTYGKQGFVTILPYPDAAGVGAHGEPLKIKTAPFSDTSAPTIVIEDQGEADPNAAITPTHDGDVGHINGGLWALVRDGLGESSNTGSVLVYTSMRTTVTSDNFDDLFRGMFTFDISAISADPSAAILTLTVEGILETLAGQEVVLVIPDPADKTSFVNADYETMSDTAISDVHAITGWVQSDTVDFTFNAAGISALNAAILAGDTYFTVACIFESDRTDTAPTWVSDVKAEARWRSVDHGTAADRPSLVIYDAAVAQVTLWHDDPNGQTDEIQKRVFSTPMQGSVKATGTLTFAADPAATDTVTIGTTTYTYIAVLASAYDVLVGGTRAASIANLVAAINDSGVEGTNYGTGTAAHTSVSAVDNVDDTVTVTARTPGSAGNSIPTTTSEVDITFGATTLVSDLAIAWETHLSAPVAEGTHGGANALVGDPISVGLYAGVTSWIQARLKYADAAGNTLYTSPITSSGFDLGREPNVITFEAIADQDWGVSPHIEVDFDALSIRIAGTSGVTPTAPDEDAVLARDPANISDSAVGRTFDRIETAMFYEDFPITVAEGETAVFSGQAYAERDGTGRASDVYTCQITRPKGEIGGGDPTLGAGVTLTVTDGGGGTEDYLVDWTATDANITSAHYVYIEVFKYGFGLSNVVADSGTENDPSTGGTQTMTLNATPTEGVGGRYRAEVFLKLDADNSILDHRSIFDLLEI